jgi:hypothetical protein
MSQDLFLQFPVEVILALLAMSLILLAVARVLIALRTPVPVRMPGRYGAEAPYKIEAQALLMPGQVDVVPQAGREPANR